MSPLDNIGPGPLFSIFPLLALVLPLLAWIALYARGASARDLIFWGAISVVIPILGPLAAIIFALRIKADKVKRQKTEPG